MISTQRMAFRLPPLVLMTWGALLLYLPASGQLRTLLNPLFWPLEIGCGIVLSFLGAGYFLFFRPVSRTVPQEKKMIWQVGVLLLPFAVAVLNVPSSLSAGALEARSALSGGRVLAQMAPVQRGKNDVPSLVDFATAAFYPEHIPEVSDKCVDYLGQYLPGEKAGEYRFCRVLISCCAADATPVYLHIVGTKPNATAMEWIEVKGKTFFRQNDGDWEPCVRIDSVSKVSPPPDPYLYAIRMGQIPSG